MWSCNVKHLEMWSVQLLCMRQTVVRCGVMGYNIRDRLTLELEEKVIRALPGSWKTLNVISSFSMIVSETLQNHIMLTCLDNDTIILYSLRWRYTHMGCDDVTLMYTNACGKERKNKPQMPRAKKERPNHKRWWQTKNGCPNQANKRKTAALIGQANEKWLP